MGKGEREERGRREGGEREERGRREGGEREKRGRREGGEREERGRREVYKQKTKVTPGHQAQQLRSEITANIHPLI